MNELQKEQYIKLTHFLGQVLGPSYEIVFHVITSEGTHIAAIANNHISGRTLESPLTAFGIKLIQDKTYLEQDSVLDYKALTNDVKSLRGSTFFIKDGDRLVGILTINHDTSEMKKVLRRIIDLEKLDNASDIICAIDGGMSKQTNHELVGIETLNHSIEDIIAESLDLSYLQSGFTLTTKQKQEAINNLYHKGVFNIKGAIPIIANLLKMSEPSVYRYLQNLKRNERNAK